MSSACDSDCEHSCFIGIGSSLCERLRTGKISEDRIDEYEKKWGTKVACLEANHTKKNKLDMSEAERLLRELEKFTAHSVRIVCPDQKRKILKCLQENKEDSLKCSEEIGEFANCVDAMLAKTSREDYTECQLPKKPTYKEKFERLSSGCGN